MSKEVDETVSPQCKKCGSFFTSSSLLKHISHSKQCKSWYNSGEILSMKKEAKKQRNKIYNKKRKVRFSKFSALNKYYPKIPLKNPFGTQIPALKILPLKYSSSMQKIDLEFS